MNKAPAFASAEAEGAGADFVVRSGGAVGLADDGFGDGAAGTDAAGLLGAVGVGVDGGALGTTSGTTLGL
ncbi:MAG TPA: hypothetical protein VFI62_08310 [Burkholderiales bacterium]|nr:hypothetical protein [Burkholderiales bacterium]